MLTTIDLHVTYADTYTRVYLRLLMFTYVYTCLHMFCSVYLCLLVFTSVYLCLSLFIRLYLCLLVFTYVYHGLILQVYIMFTHNYYYLPMSTLACLFFTPVKSCLLMFTYVYVFTNVQWLHNPMGFIISSHMSYAWRKGALNYWVWKPLRGSMEALIRNITKNLGLSDCYHFKF